jgi:hypothetical protein
MCKFEEEKNKQRTKPNVMSWWDIHTHTHTYMHSIPIACLFFFCTKSRARKKKRNIQTGYTELMIDAEWPNDCEKNDLYKKRKKRKKPKHSWGSHTKTKTNRQVSSLKKNTPD